MMPHHPGFSPVLLRVERSSLTGTRFYRQGIKSYLVSVLRVPIKTQTVEKPGFRAERTRTNHHGLFGDNVQPGEQMFFKDDICSCFLNIFGIGGRLKSWRYKMVLIAWQYQRAATRDCKDI